MEKELRFSYDDEGDMTGILKPIEFEALGGDKNVS